MQHRGHLQYPAHSASLVWMAVNVQNQTHSCRWQRQYQNSDRSLRRRNVGWRQGQRAANFLFTSHHFLVLRSVRSVMAGLVIECYLFALIIYCCVKVIPKPTGVKNIRISGTASLVVQVQSLSWCRCQDVSWVSVSSEGSPGAGGPASKMAPAHGYWQEASAPYCMDLPWNCQSICTTWQWSVPGVTYPRERKARKKPECLLCPDLSCRPPSLVPHSVRSKWIAKFNSILKEKQN